MKIEWMPIAVAGGPTIALMLIVVWLEFIKPRLERRRRMLRRLGLEYGHIGPNEKIIAMRRRYEDVVRKRSAQTLNEMAVDKSAIRS